MIGTGKVESQVGRVEGIVGEQLDGLAKGGDRLLVGTGFVVDLGEFGQHPRSIGSLDPVEPCTGLERPLVEDSGLVVGVDVTGPVSRHLGEVPRPTPPLGVEVVQREELGELLGPAVAVGEDRITDSGVEVLAGAEGEAGVGNVTDQGMVELDPARTAQGEKAGQSLDGSGLIQRRLAGTGKHYTLELGGKAANIIFADAALDQAVEGIVNAIFFNQGHVCCAGSRLLVQEAVADEVIARLKDRMETLIVGDPLDKNTDIGAINSAAQLEKIEEYLRIGQEEGAQMYQSSARLPQGELWTSFLRDPDGNLLGLQELRAA